MVILVTGAGGQVGQAIRSVHKSYPEAEFIFCNSSELDISDMDSVTSVFALHNPDYCINAAAYTAVDKAESEPDMAYIINVTGVRNIAEACKRHQTVLLHISTDFVFDGSKRSPYTEEDIPHPTGIYGQTKLQGEYAVQQALDEYYIVRTSWVYSQFGHNFMKTMLRLSAERDSISVVDDQIGTPTHAVDLANALMQIILSDANTTGANRYGVYNFSSEGYCSWYDFAKKIFEINKIEIDLRRIKTIDYPVAAKRPAFSVLNKNKIRDCYGIDIGHWDKRLLINISN